MRFDANPILPRPADRDGGWAPRFVQKVFDLFRANAEALNDEFGFRWSSLQMPASHISLGGATPPTVDGTDSTGVPGTLLFSGVADNMVGLLVQMPREWDANTLLGDGTYSGIVRPHVRWSKTTPTAGAATWEMYWRLMGSPGETAGAWSSAVAGTDVTPSVSAVADTHMLTSFGDVTLTGQKSACMVAMRIYRRGASDAYPSDARLLEVDVHYRVARLGTAAEYPTS